MALSTLPRFTFFVILRLPTLMLLTKDTIGIFASLSFNTLMEVLLWDVEVIRFEFCSSVSSSDTVYVPVGRSVTFAIPSTRLPSPLTAVILPLVIVIVTCFVISGVTPLSLFTVKWYSPSTIFVPVTVSPLTVTVFAMFRLPLSRLYLFVYSIFPVDISSPVN